MKNITYIFFALFLTAVSPAYAAGGGVAIPDHPFSFDGHMGAFDQGALQRGYQVYKEVCAACHAAKYVRFRNLSEIGFSEAEVKALAAQYTIMDGPNDEGEMFERARKPSDQLASPFANEMQARAANNGAYPSDLSTIVKARSNGADYVYALLMGYKDAPADVELSAGMAYNEYFPGNQIAMAMPLFEDGVEYADGTTATVAQMSEDVTTFLAWASEPEMMERKRLGVRVLIFLILLAGFFYASKKRVWRNLDH